MPARVTAKNVGGVFFETQCSFLMADFGLNQIVSQPTRQEMKEF